MADLQIGGVDDTYEFIVGTSILTEFALSHTPADVLRELVQNEYDAGGTELQIEFGNETLIVRGNGTPIDAQGWKRLAVMLGTGAIAGSSERIDAKVNGIGSKNFGMRSLFLFGDSIHVASGGKRTILDRTRGSLKILQSDPASERASGVVITVPYRSVDDGPLEVFDTARERDALSAIASQLAHTVIKLAQPGPGNSLRTVHLRSERLGHELRWSQTARRADGPRGPVRRTVRVKASPGLLDGSSASISELEYHAVLEPPVPMRTRNLPGYFRVAGGRIRIGLSFRLRGKRLDLNAGGLLYYPLGAPSAHTGFPFSVSAPFDMNEDRSNIIDPQNSGWNSWLLEQVAQFAIRTLPERLFPDHGADAYAAVVPSSGGTAALPELDDKIRELISTEHCWPSRAKRRGGRAKFAPAKSLVVPPKSGLAKYIARFLSVEQLMEADLADRDEVTQLAVKCGAKVFTESSVVRLRSAGESSDHLETKISDREANYHYMDFPEPLEKLDLQRTFAAALDECWPRLVPGHKADLRTAPTTLTAAGTLDAAENLYVLDEAFAGVVPAGERLHPDLMSYPCLTRLCNPFHASQWVIRKSKELADGTGSVEDRVALAAYIRGAPQLSKKAWAAVQHAPILSDRRGELVAPRDMVRSSAKGATVLAYALHIPLPEDEGNESLKQLKFREKVAGSDLMHLAMLVEEGSVPPKVMAIACRRLPELLSRSVIRQLSDIGFLETESGAISAPTQTYSRSERLVAVLGEEAPYAVGLTPKVLRHLGCRSEALADDIVAALSRWNESGRKPSRSELACRALVDALRHERRATNEFENHDIIWTGRAWEAPADCLVGVDYRTSGFGPVTLLSGSHRDVWSALGAPTRPTSQHWQRFFAWASDVYGSQERTPPSVIETLRRGYRELAELPAGTGRDTKCLVDERGQLHPISLATVRRYCINDDPALAREAVTAGAAIAIAPPLDRQELPFFKSIGAQSLSSVATLISTNAGPALQESHVRVDTTLQRLRSSQFASAVVALVSGLPDTQPRRSGELARQLAQIERIDVVDGISKRYRVAGTAVLVPINYWVSDNVIRVSRARQPGELRRAVADAIADLADISPHPHQLLGDAIYFLLLCRSVSEMRRELERRKIPWEGGTQFEDAGFDDGDDEDDESASIAASIGRSVVRDAFRHPSPSPSKPPKLIDAARNPRQPLPNLQDVKPEPVGALGEPKSRAFSGQAGGGSGAWSPRNDDARSEDRELGRRGEEIVLDIERERVKTLGLPPERVVWTADAEPAADHDIKSVDDDGDDLWIEVKSTTGRDGRFSWSRGEFSLAVRARERYVLYRVYEANSTVPKWKPLSPARVMGPPLCHEHGTGCVRSRAVW